nr:hemocyanin-like 1 (Hcl-1) gene [Biomphalaria glabrata]
MVNMFYLKFLCHFFKWSHSQNKVQMYQLFLLTDIKFSCLPAVWCYKSTTNIKQVQCTYQQDEKRCMEYNVNILRSKTIPRGKGTDTPDLLEIFLFYHHLETSLCSKGTCHYLLIANWH